METVAFARLISGKDVYQTRGRDGSPTFDGRGRRALERVKVTARRLFQVCVQNRRGRAFPPRTYTDDY